MSEMAGDPSLSRPDDAHAAAEARYRRAVDEVARLSQPDDHGSGERTARLAALGAWEQELESARRDLQLMEVDTGRLPVD